MFINKSFGNVLGVCTLLFVCFFYSFLLDSLIWGGLYWLSIWVDDSLWTLVVRILLWLCRSLAQEQVLVLFTMSLFFLSLTAWQLLRWTSCGRAWGGKNQRMSRRPAARTSGGQTRSRWGGGNAVFLSGWVALCVPPSSVPCDLSVIVHSYKVSPLRKVTSGGLETSGNAPNLRKAEVTSLVHGRPGGMSSNSWPYSAHILSHSGENLTTDGLANPTWCDQLQLRNKGAGQKTIGQIAAAGNQLHSLVGWCDRLGRWLSEFNNRQWKIPPLLFSRNGEIYLFIIFYLLQVLI